MASREHYSKTEIKQMIDFLRKAASEDMNVDCGDLWAVNTVVITAAMCNEAADMIESMLHYEQNHGLRECDENG